MGGDIHGPFIEVNEFPGQENAWYSRAEWSTWRDYSLFAALAGVRSNDVDCPTNPKGFPDDASGEWRRHYEEFGDCHTPSWLTLHELRAAGDAYREEYPDGSGDIEIWATVMAYIEEHEGKAVRIGFCFDN